VGGFVFNALTLKRVDMFLEIFWVIAHLIIVGICIIWINMIENENEDEKNPSKMLFWLVNTLQWFFGGLLSTYLVFYFRSADLSTSWPFILMLVLAFWANESLKNRYARLHFQIPLFYLSLFAFTIFFIPVLVHAIGSKIFLLSGAVSLITIGIFMLVLAVVSREKFIQSTKVMISPIAVIFIVVNILYFSNIIPPIPLSLKDGGVYHSVTTDANGGYIVQQEKRGWRARVKLYPDVHLRKADPAYVFSAIFLPPLLNTTIVHNWQHDNPETGEWTDSERIVLPVVGGREGGFRTYSMKANMLPGHWRITVATLKGEVIGRVRFNVAAVDSKPLLHTKIHG